MHLYIQPISHDFDTSQRLAYLAEERGVKVHTTQSGGMIPNFDIPNDGPIIYQGGINGMKAAQRWMPNLINWCDWKALRCSNYFAYWGKFLLSRNYSFYPLAELVRLSKTDWFWSTFAHRDKVFIKPDTNDKAFNGEVVHRKNIDAWEVYAKEQNPNATLLCLVSQPEEIDSEWRFIVADGKAIAGSRYRLEGRIDHLEGMPDMAIELAEKASKVWSPHRIFCLDIAFSDGVPTIIECGSVNVAGFYQCKLEPIIDAFIHIAKEEWEVAQDGI